MKKNLPTAAWLEIILDLTAEVYGEFFPVMGRDKLSRFTSSVQAVIEEKTNFTAYKVGQIAWENFADLDRAATLIELIESNHPELKRP